MVELAVNWQGAVQLEVEARAAAGLVEVAMAAASEVVVAEV